MLKSHKISTNTILNALFKGQYNYCLILILIINKFIVNENYYYVKQKNIITSLNLRKLEY
jgi:hypothetical protein